MVGTASISRLAGSMRAEFVAALAAALEADAETFKNVGRGTVMDSMVRGLVCEAQKGRASAIRLIFQYLEQAKRDASPQEPVRAATAPKRTACQKGPTESSSPEGSRMREAEFRVGEKLDGLETKSGEQRARPDTSGGPVDLETARRVAECLRVQQCDSPAQEELRQRFLRLAEAEVAEHEQRATDPKEKEHKGNICDNPGADPPDRYG